MNDLRMCRRSKTVLLSFAFLPVCVWGTAAPAAAPTPYQTSMPTPGATFGGGGATKFYCASGDSNGRKTCPDGGSMSTTYSRVPSPEPTW